MLLHPLVALLADDLLGGDGLGGHALDEERVGAVRLEADGVVVDDLHTLDLGVVAAGDHLLGGVEHALEGRLDVLGGEGRAVVELDTLAQFDLPRRVVDGLPRDGEVGADLARLEIAHGQVVVDLVAEDDGLAKDGAGRIPRVDVGLQRVHDGVILRLRGRLPGQGEGDQGEQDESKSGGASHDGLLRRGDAEMPMRR
jgi:hypothetical protein